MGYHVVKPFNSVNRKFAAGAPISASDIDPTSATTFDQWLASGFVGDDVPPAPAKAARSAASGE